jgi:hypothetical protein
MIKLFCVRTAVKEFHGHRNVMLEFFVEGRKQRLFGPDGSLGIAYSDVIKDYDVSDYCARYAEGAVEECFTEAEANEFIAWTKQHRNDHGAMITPVTLPISKNSMGCGAVPVGGLVDHLMVGEAEDYDLPFKVYGYFDLRQCEQITA